MARDGVGDDLGELPVEGNRRADGGVIDAEQLLFGFDEGHAVLLRVIDDRLDARVEAAAHDELADVVEQRGRRRDRRKVR